ncbi:MAG: ATP-binding protein [Sphingobium sp.]
MTDPCAILIIDDNADDREYYRRILNAAKDGSYHVAEAEDGESALALLRTERFDCILLDYSLPGRNGLDLLRLIRADHPHLAIIMLTGQGDIDIAVRAIKEKASDYLVKSPDLRERLDPAIMLAVDNAATARKADLSRRYLRQMLEHIPDPIFMKDEQHRWVDGNSAFWALMKGLPATFIGKTDHDLFPAAQADPVRASERDVFATGQVHVCEEECIDLEGKKHHLITKKGLFHDHEDRTLLVGVMHDITVLKTQQDALATSERTFRLAIENAFNGMALVSPEGRWLKVNKALCQLLGYREIDLLANDIASITHPDDRLREEELLADIWNDKQGMCQFEKRFIHVRGPVITVMQSMSVIRHSDGSPNHLVVQMLDVTEARKIDRMKSEFISTVSHELRTPLTSIRGSLGLMAQPFAAELTPAGRELIEIAGENCERLIAIINDILDIDKIASGKMWFDMELHDAANLVERAVRTNAAYARKFGIAIRCGNLPQGCWLAVDETRFGQVMANLISNAAKFSGNAPSIDIAMERIGGHVRISVTDHGEGIAEEFHDRIFGKFAQADSSTARRKEGTGLGLHISRQLIEKMGGQIGFESEVGIGTTFWIDFPQAEPAVLPEPLSASGA